MEVVSLTYRKPRSGKKSRAIDLESAAQAILAHLGGDRVVEAHQVIPLFGVYGPLAIHQLWHANRVRRLYYGGDQIFYAARK